MIHLSKVLVRKYVGQMTENKKYLKIAYFSNAAVLAPGVLLFIV